MKFWREDIAGFVDEATSGIPIYKITDNPTEAGFIDATSVEALDDCGLKAAGKDYKFVRDFIKSIVDASGGFSAQNDDTKTICCKYKVGTHSQMEAFLGSQDELIALMKSYNHNTKICRIHRWEEIDVLLRNELSDNHKDVVSEARQPILDYIHLGVEGTDAGDLEGLLDYLLGKTGTSYAGVGLINKAWSPFSMTITDLANKCYNIALHGEYYYTPNPYNPFI